MLQRRWEDATGSFAWSYLAALARPGNGHRSSRNAGFELGRRLLGPILYRFCQDLRLHQLAYAERQPVALFEARAGLRIRYLFELYLETAGLAPPCEQVDFYVSRLSACVACLPSDFDYVATIIAGQYRYQRAAEMLEGILPADVFWRAQEVWAPSTFAGELDKPASVEGLRWAFQHNRVLRDYVEEQHALLGDYLEALMAGHRYGLLIDTGWSGTTQDVIARRFSAWQWQGLYACRYNYGEPDPPLFAHIVGILSEDPAPSAANPLSALLCHRHLLEGPLEPPVPSVTGYRRQPSGEVTSIHGPAPREVVRGSEEEPIFAGIVQHFREADPERPLSTTQRDARRAAAVLHRTIHFPRPSDVRAMWVAPRSADFGKDLIVPVVDTDLSDRSLRARYLRYRRTLWPQGQLTLDWPRLHPLLNLLEGRQRLRDRSLTWGRRAKSLIRLLVERAG